MTTVALRPVEAEDLPILFTHQADPEAARMASFPSRTREAFDAHWERISNDPTTIARTVVFEGEVAGTIGSWDGEADRSVGYWVGREHWGRGVATAALAAFREVERTRPLVARVVEHNLGSIRVLEKCGFVHSGEERGPDGMLELVYRYD
jgi:RimJ/RimL family protein N-acetyltransferase